MALEMKILRGHTPDGGLGYETFPQRPWEALATATGTHKSRYFYVDMDVLNDKKTLNFLSLTSV